MLKMRSGLRKGSHETMFIGPGAIYKGFKSPSDLGTLLGATKGGNKISIKTEWHDAEIDGALGPVRGARWLTACEVELESSLLEMSLDNLKLQLPGSVIDSSREDYDVISHTDDISLIEYETFAIVGELIGKKKPIIFVLENAVATDPLEIDTGNGKDDVVLKVKIVGTYSEEDPTKPPYAIYYPRDGVAIPDVPPVANPTIEGVAKVGEVLTANSGYSDANGDVESGTTYAFYSYESDGVSNPAVVQAASTVKTYTIKASDEGKVIRVRVVPKNAKGQGVEASSAPTDVIGPEVTETEPDTGTETGGTEGQ